ncbi:hypothetical protein Cadr_000026220 [Camelus dromedarius]|uniref:Uncharacterized protein n=1 Tax=Camelus dromedarius TaxID=9838 RepID=A0A5N4CEK7_CAMDR|nr:hypothetical protein Cadr_000026220 [Camelus dromedarius]
MKPRVFRSGMLAALRRCIAASAVFWSLTSSLRSTVALWMRCPLNDSPTTPVASMSRGFLES